MPRLKSDWIVYVPAIADGDDVIVPALYWTGEGFSGLLSEAQGVRRYERTDGLLRPASAAAQRLGFDARRLDIRRRYWLEPSTQAPGSTRPPGPPRRFAG